MRNTYVIHNIGPNHRKTVKQAILNRLKDFTFPCDVVLVTKDETKKYYVEQSNISGGGLFVVNWECTQPLEKVNVR